MNTTSEKVLRRLIIEGSEVEENAPLFGELAGGIEILSSSSFAIYLSEDSQVREEVSALAKRCGFIISHEEALQDRNWVAENSDLLKPVIRGRITVLPVLSSEQKFAALPTTPPSEQQTLYLLPGMGFGTGHHATTGMLLELLSAYHYTPFEPSHALDLGTGSGVLALAVALLYGVKVDAIDIDRDALKNAAENLSLNPEVASGITLIEGGIERAHNATYPLVCANLYAELLVELAPKIIELLSTGGYLFLSGIMTTLEPIVRDAFSSLELVERRSELQWAALVYRRIH